ncbi:MAG: HIT domain-containing protein [Proteobacteria bacterium]|nr:HIT domain-containing protein [Pseudomonadota bacterium]
MSLHGAYDDNNIFAKILRGEAASVKAFEDDVALAFMDLFPQSRGHTLVIPKGQKVKNFLEMEETAIGAYLQRVQRVAKAVTRALKPDGVVVAHYNGAPGGQTIFYPHFHIIPRYEGVGLAGHSHQKRADIAELERIAQSIAAAL